MSRQRTRRPQRIKHSRNRRRVHSSRSRARRPSAPANDRPHLGQAQTLTRPVATLSRPMGEGAEKENRSPRFGDTNAPGCRADSPANDRKAAMGRGTSEISSDAGCCSLSPGERVRVRASQDTNLFDAARSEFNARPHPSLLPRGEGELFAGFLECRAAELAGRRWQWLRVWQNFQGLMWRS